LIAYNRLENISFEFFFLRNHRQGIFNNPIEYSIGSGAVSPCKAGHTISTSRGVVVLRKIFNCQDLSDLLWLFLWLNTLKPN
jgi:hypothetical protein